MLKLGAKCLWPGKSKGRNKSKASFIFSLYLLDYVSPARSLRNTFHTGWKEGHSMAMEMDEERYLHSSSYYLESLRGGFLQWTPKIIQWALHQYSIV